MNSLRYWPLLCLVLALPLTAAEGLYDFETEKQRQRFRELTEQLRCPKCSSQSIGGSNAPIAKDMREKTAELIKQGRSNEEIVHYFVERYGQFVNFRPPVETSTLLLWGGPVVVFVLGAVVVVVQIRRARRAPAQGEQR